MSGLSTHILDTSIGRPAPGVLVILSRRASGGQFDRIGSGETDQDGRARQLLGDQALEAGVYELNFQIAPYFERRGVSTFFPEVRLVFAVTKRTEHHHVPLLLSPFGYSTYRGS